MSAPAEKARRWLAQNSLIIDTETTGLGDNAEIVEIAVIDCRGAVLLDTLIRPSVAIPAEATRVHGIDDSMVASAPTWAEVHDQFCRLITGRRLVAYNSEFDHRLILQTMRAAGLTLPYFSVECAMLAYADFWGEFDPERGRNRWQKLTGAAAQQGVECDGLAHRAKADCLLTLGVIHAMARAQKASASPTPLSLDREVRHFHFLGSIGGGKTQAVHPIFLSATEKEGE